MSKYHMVEAGIVTGIFYIPLGGIKYGERWQDLKDHIRASDGEPPIDVLQVDIYGALSGKVGGWVSIRGEKDFLRVMRNLQYMPFRGMNLITFGGNHFQPVTLLSNPETLNQHNRTARPVEYTNEYLPQVQGYQSYGVDNVSHSVSHHVVQPSQLTSYPVQYTHYQLPAEYPSYFQDSTMSMPSNNPGFIASGDVSSTLYSSDTNISPHPQYETSRLVSLSRRQVFLKGLPKNVKEGQVRGMVHKTLDECTNRLSGVSGSDSSSRTSDVIEKLELSIPIHSWKRGHCFITFYSGELADVVIRALNGRRWRGSLLQARWDRDQPAVISTEYASDEMNTTVDDEEDLTVEDYDDYVGDDTDEAQEANIRRPSTPAIVNGSDPVSMVIDQCRSSKNETSSPSSASRSRHESSSSRSKGKGKQKRSWFG